MKPSGRLTFDDDGGAIFHGQPFETLAKFCLGLVMRRQPLLAAAGGSAKVHRFVLLEGGQHFANDQF